MVDQSTYPGLPARVSGLQSRLARSRQLDKVWRQSSSMAAVLTQFIMDRTGQDALDDGTKGTRLSSLRQAAPAAVNAVGVNSSLTVNGVNAPNPLFTGSGEFGNAGWLAANLHEQSVCRRVRWRHQGQDALTSATHSIQQPPSGGFYYVEY